MKISVLLVFKNKLLLLSILLHTVLQVIHRSEYQFGRTVVKNAMFIHTYTIHIENILKKNNNNKSNNIF